MSMHEMAKRGGFKGAIGNESGGYVLLTEQTDGKMGRKIFINAKLAPKFKAMVEESKQNYVLFQLSQLRALSGTGSAFTNIDDPKEHRTKCGDLDVTYVIRQHKVGDDKPGVYITDIDYGLFGAGNTPGTYKVTRDEGEWRLENKLTDGISTQNAAINGLAKSLPEAAREIMPPMVEYAYGKSGDSKTRLDNEGFTLFYNPQSIMVKGKKWKTPEQKSTNHKLIAKNFAQELVRAQKLGKKVQWTIHGNGSAVLKSALEMLPGQDLSVHEVMFMAPEGRLDKLLPLVGKARMGVHDDGMKYSDAEVSWSKLSNKFLRSDKVAKQFKAIKANANRANEIAAEGRNEVLETSYEIGSSLGELGAALWDFSLHFSVGMVNPFKLWTNLHVARNTVASSVGINNSNLNPHQSPHMSTAEFNQHVSSHTGKGNFISKMASSYGTTFKSLLDKITG